MKAARFTVKMKHDKGTINLVLVASDFATAIKKACDAERAPERAVKSVTLNKVIY